MDVREVAYAIRAMSGKIHGSWGGGSPWFPKFVSPLPLLLFLLQSLIDHPSPCFLLPDPRLAAGAQMETGCYSLY